MKKERILLIDFDSTFVTVESLDQLAEIVLRERDDKQQVLDRIVAITKQGMEGKITFAESLARRLQLFKPNKEHLKELIQLLHKKVTPSIKRNNAFFQENAEGIYVLSGGFKDYMVPVLRKYGVLLDHILGNTFLFDKKGNVMGYDKDNPLAQERGKVKIMQAMNFDTPIIMVGDGYTDYEIKQAGFANKFIAFVENVTRDPVVKKADVVAKNFEEVINNL